MILIFALLLGSVVGDVTGQVCFKLGLNADTVPPHPGPLGFVTALVHSPWVVLGMLVYAVEFVIWYAALTLAPLSLAFPFAALSYCGVVLASRFVLHERVSRQRWFATLVVAAGVALVCIS